MQTRFGRWSRPMTLALSLCVMVACGDDDDPTTEGSQTETGGNAAKGGTGGKAGASAGSGGRAGASAGTGGTRAGSGATAGTTAPPGGGMFTCEEAPSTEPVKCGGEVCTAPSFSMNTCIVSCCINVGGKETCGSKSTAMGLVTECSGPITPDPSCPKIEDGQGGMLEGCCNASKKKCGIISTLRPTCVTESMLITFPNPLQECGGDTGSDAGTPDAG